MFSTLFPERMPSTWRLGLLLAVLMACSTALCITVAGWAMRQNLSSIARAVVEAAQAGLEPTGSLGGAYLVPFFNGKTGRKEAQLIIGYTGLVKLARRSGEVAKVEARVVRQADEFDYGYGLDPYLIHRPALGLADDAANPMTHAYAVVHFRTGEKQFDVMSAAEILAIKARSKSKDRNGNLTGPWVTDEAEMWKKTVLRRASKLMPLTIEAQRVLDAEEAIDTAPRNVTPAPRVTAPSRIAARLVGGETTSAQAAGAAAGHESAPPAHPVAALDADPAPEAGAPADGAGEAYTTDGEIVDATAVELCPSTSPYEGSAACIHPAGHSGHHRSADKESWA